MTASEPPEASGPFCTTQWTQIIEVIQKGAQDEALQALGAFCGQYRDVIYKFIRRRGCSHEEAEDLVPQFIETRILRPWEEHNTFLHQARRDVATRFRSLLCQVLIWFLSDVADRKRRLKRGGSAVHESVEALDELGHIIPAGSPHDPGREFDLLFAEALIEKVCQSQKYSQQHLDLLMGKKTQSAVAAELGDGLGSWQRALRSHANREVFFCSQRLRIADEYVQPFAFPSTRVPLHYGYNHRGGARKNLLPLNLGLGGDYVSSAEGGRFAPCPEGRVLAPAQMIAIGDGDANVMLGLLASSVQPRDYTNLLHLIFPHTIELFGRPGVGAWHNSGANMLFCDGHVAFGKQKHWTQPTHGSRRLWNNDHEPHSDSW